MMDVKGDYYSGRDDLAKDFFEPCLRQCKLYKRAVGYFSSSALSTWGEALPRILDNDNSTVLLLISPE